MVTNSMDYLTIALPKGKLFGLSADMFAKIGYTAEDLSEKSRKLIISNDDKKIRFIIRKNIKIYYFFKSHILMDEHKNKCSF